MKVLILTIPTGQGHNQTANAIEEYFSEKGMECVVLDALKYVSTLLAESVEKGYLLSTQYVPGVYGRFYRLAEKREPNGDETTLVKITNRILSKKLVNFINNFVPDVIICTHVYAAQMITDVADEIVPCKTIGIVTDFAIHPFWEDTNLDCYVTVSNLLNNQCLKKGIPLEKVKPFGIPIHMKFSKKMPKEEARAKLGLENKRTVLVMMGSMGYGNMAKLIGEMDRLSMDFQIVSICGKNERSKKKIDSFKFTHKVYNYGFVGNVDEFMDAADFIVTKPGGLTVSESMAKGLPMILVNPIPGQEGRNLEFLLNNGLAMYITKTFPIDEAVFQFFSNEWRMEFIKGAVSYIGRPNAVKDLYDYVMGIKNEA